MKKTMFAFALTSTLVALLSACATEQTDLYTKKTTAIAKKSYSKAKGLADEYYVTVRDDVKSFENSQPDEMDERFDLLENQPNAPALEIEDVLTAGDLKPDRIYTTTDVTAILSLLDVKETISELGLKHVHIFFLSSRLTPFQWAFGGDTMNQFKYQFIWFDANGNKIATDTAPRIYESIPGSSVRIVGYAPTEECKKFSLVLLPHKEKTEEFEEEDDGIVTLIDKLEKSEKSKEEAPVKETPVAVDSGNVAPASASSSTSPKTAEDTKKLIEANK